MFRADDDCPNPVQILDSPSLEVITDGDNITSSCTNDYWRAPTGQKSEIIIDLGCSIRLETFSVLNGFGDFGTKDFSLHGSRDVSGPWTHLFQGQLQQGYEMTDEVNRLMFDYT